MEKNSDEIEQHLVGTETSGTTNGDMKTATHVAPSYFDCGTTEIITGLLKMNTAQIEEPGLDDPMPFSDLSDPSRHLWIVTTAGLPWRTGTAINPFLRSLYFIRKRMHLYKSEDNKPGKVSLVIPWLESAADRRKVYGERIDKSGEEGQQQQIDWIKEYASDMCDMKEEMEHLNILFYDAAYWPAFGSIFPTVDICSLIPNEEADIAVLEEPEHLNWMRVPNHDYFTKDSQEKSWPLSEEIPVEKGETDKSLENRDPSAAVIVEGNDEVSKKNFDHELGWAHKFTFVVGIIHTNYSAYMKQYGLGTTIVAAPALKALSSMVVRAYCHKVVRLSGVIPKYASWKEVTCNVHGVRSDFLQMDNTDNSESPNTDEGESSPVYFIGKLLWAKGFDKMLKIQEAFRKANPSKEYFSIDVYGGGPDELDIKRAFHGRMQPPKTPSDTESISSADSNEETNIDSNEESRRVLTTSTSIRNQIMKLTKSVEEKLPKAFNEAKNLINAGFEVIVPDDAGASTNETIVETNEFVKNESSISETEVVTSKQKNPLAILSDVSEKSISTGIATTNAVKNLADSAIKAGLAMTFTKDELDESAHGDSQSQRSYRFDPPKTIYELRRTPIPAKFLGVKDHAQLRTMPCKVFLNPSITEVLCTTTAEALAMGKFVVIPKHVSNEFFFQFTNCLPYESISECVEKLQWALDNDPSPLTEEEAHIFTWEAATDRMIKSSIITKREARARSKDGFDKTDSRMAWIHSKSGKQSSLIKSTFMRVRSAGSFTDESKSKSK